jgi:hypothetical protein
MNCLEQDSISKIRSGETDYSDSRVFCRLADYFPRLNLNLFNATYAFPFTMPLIFPTSREVKWPEDYYILYEWYVQLF